MLTHTIRSNAASARSIFDGARITIDAPQDGHVTTTIEGDVRHHVGALAAGACIAIVERLAMERR